MPTVPPLPQKPNFETQPQPEDVKPTPDTASSASEPAGSIPDTSGTPLSLTPDEALTPSPSSPASPAAPSAPQTAPDAKPTE
jgi:hypothetical protein